MSVVVTVAKPRRLAEDHAITDRMRRHLYRAGVAACLLTLFGMAASAQALTAPQIYLKETGGRGPTGSWIPVNGAAVHSAVGYELGVKIQSTGKANNEQLVLARVTSVPDGHPDQPEVQYPYCVGVSGTPGDIVPTGERIHYEGDGRYTLQATLSERISDLDKNCGNGATSIGSFTASTETQARFFGHLVILAPPGEGERSGLEIRPRAPNFVGEWRCARDPRPTSGGGLTGTRTTHGTWRTTSRQTVSANILFTSPGKWACVARSLGGSTPGSWSASTPTKVVQTGFYPARKLRLTDWNGPTYGLKEQLDPLTAGAVVKLKLKGHHVREKLRARVREGGVAKFKFRLPHVRLKPPFYDPVGIKALTSFGGSRLVAPRKPFHDFSLAAVRSSGGTDLAFASIGCRPHRC